MCKYVTQVSCISHIATKGICCYTYRIQFLPLLLKDLVQNSLKTLFKTLNYFALSTHTHTHTHKSVYEYSKYQLIPEPF
jgi:hypothetical protein